MITSSADFSGNFGCGSTGMPRPLSVTVKKAVGRELDVDEGGMAGHRLVHGIVDHLGEEVVQRLLVGAADIHARTPAHRLQPFQHLDVGGAVAFAAVLRLRAALGRGLEDGVERARGLSRAGAGLSRLAKRSSLSSMA